MPHLGELYPRTVVLGAVVPTISGSPWVYTANLIGMLTITGGVISIVSYARSSDIALMPLAGSVMMMPGDTVTITYLTAPTVKFFPWLQ